MSSNIRRSHSVNIQRPTSRLEIEASIEGKIQRIEIPQYALKYPNFDRVNLPVVKHNIYHPHLPSFYKYVIDDFASKPPIENARTSTKLNADHFFKNKEELKRSSTTLSYPIRLIGDIGQSAKILRDKDKPRSQSAELERITAKLENENLNGFSTYRPVNCVAGRENCVRTPDEKMQRVFRYNRVRSVLSDRPTQGHKPAYFDTTPALDKFGQRVEAATASKFRDTNPIRTNSKPGFIPYGYTSAFYKNYIMYYPRS